MQILDPVITLAILLAAALVGGMVAHRLRQPIIVGYLLIGVAVGPHSLGLVNDVQTIESVATIGVALLMFTLGLEVSVDQLREVGKVGIRGGAAQIVITAALGTIIGLTVFQWPMSQALVFGLIVSLSSTSVCLKILMDRGELNSVHGRIMISMLVLQDIAVVLMIVILPLLGAGAGNLLVETGVAAGKAVLFVGAAVLLGRWVIPWLLGSVGGIRSRELFLLTVFVLCLSAAIGTYVFGLSMVFGAFLVGLVLRETKFGHRALAEITPLRDVFATLFFVSLGMLLDPLFLTSEWAYVLSVVAVIVLLKSVIVFLVVRFFGYDGRIAFITGAGLFQVGEFGFVLAQLGKNTGLVSDQFYSLVLAGAVVTMLLTPLSISLSARLYPVARQTLKRWAPVKGGSQQALVPPASVVIAGYGRVGQGIAEGLQRAGIPFLIIDIDPDRIVAARERGYAQIYGDAANIHVLDQANLDEAKALVITYPDPEAVVSTAKLALSMNSNLNILARVHRAKEVEELRRLGVSELVIPEYEASFRFIKRLLNIVGLETPHRRRILALIRDRKDSSESGFD